MSCNNDLDEELKLLKSMYDDDLKYDGQEITITLSPLQEEKKKENYVKVDLCVVCSDLYPKKEPDLTLKNVKGLSDSNIETLYCKLNKLAKSHLGEVMIYDLAYCVQEFLSENNKPGKKSCYEEMIIRKEQQKQEEYQIKTRLIKDIKEKHNSSDSESSECGDDKENFSCRRNSTVHLKVPCKHGSCKYIQFNNKVLRGSCIQHDTYSITYCAVDITTGDQLLLQEWIVKPSKKNDETSDVIQKELEKIQKKIENLEKMCHENLITYIDFKWSFEKGEYIVHILQEYVSGLNLSLFIEKKIKVDSNLIRFITCGVVNALDYLHSHNIVHGCLNESNIYLTKSGLIKVANYGVKKVIDDLHHLCNGDHFWSNEEPTSKSDILQLGQLLLSLMKLQSDSNHKIMMSDLQPPEFKEFLEKCLIESDEGRWSARKLLNHKFLTAKEGRHNTPRKKMTDGGDMIKGIAEEIEKPFEFFFDSNQNANSRLAKEFKILNKLGSGSFGKVLKVKNKLDGSVYAIKAILLNMNKKQCVKKMIREVKLLSKLNHENVVRYYTSWIETDSNSSADSIHEGEDTVDSKLQFLMDKSNLVQELEDENDDDDDDDDDDEDDDDDDDDDDEEEVDGTSEKSNKLMNNDQSSYVVFLEEGSSIGKSKVEASINKSQEPDLHVQGPRATMFIQMEFCEKSTLRIAINDTNSMKLCDDEPRLWRLFREIVEGLAYVHEQDMIHRDLKPENIFLDSNDHVKIGDFGLATISAVSNCYLTYGGSSLCNGNNDASSQNVYDDFHTGRVGTSLYVAPEVDKTFEKSYYNEKVDVYSLGIIFFEMSNGPFDTEMERVETLCNLRKSEIIFPASWGEKFFEKRNLVTMLLNHDPKSRPYCSEILEGDYLPPAEFEYEQFQEVVKQTLKNPKSKDYKYLVSCCFDQETRIEEGITYHLENARSEKQHFILDLIKDRLEKILKKHGAIYLSVPLLLPQNKEQKSMDRQVKLMTHSGSIVNLPYDLRISFARYAACKAFTRFRRYVIERVYREKKVHGLHPKERYECAFDLVTPTTGIENATLEVLRTIQEIINDFESLKSRNCVIRINHSFLLKAVLTHFNSSKWYTDIFKILAGAKEDKYFKSKLELNLQTLGIQSSNILFNLFTREDSLNNIKKELCSLLTKRGKTWDELNEAFEQLNRIIGRAERSGINIPIKVTLGVVCNSEHCSNIMFDVAYQVKQKKKKEETIILMSGCRYDGLIAKFREFFESTQIVGSGDDTTAAVGVTVYLEKIIAILKEDNILSPRVVVCALGNNVMTQGKEKMANKLLDSGIQCYVEETIQTLAELTDYCRENKIIHIVNIKDEENGIAYLMTWDNYKNHYQEKKINVRDVIDNILKYSKTSEGYLTNSSSRSSLDSQGRGVANDIPSQSCSQSFNIHIISEEKSGSGQRKNYRNQVQARISPSLVGLFSSRTRLEVVGVFLDERKVKAIALNFKANDSSNISSNMESIADRYQFFLINFGVKSDYAQIKKELFDFIFM